MATCTVCECDIEFDNDTIKGELLECPDCSAVLEVISINPPKLEEAPELDEDWGQ